MIPPQKILVFNMFDFVIIDMNWIGTALVRNV